MELAIIRLKLEKNDIENVFSKLFNPDYLKLEQTLTLSTIQNDLIKEQVFPYQNKQKQPSYFIEKTSEIYKKNNFTIENINQKIIEDPNLKLDNYDNVIFSSSLIGNYKNHKLRLTIVSKKKKSESADFVTLRNKIFDIPKNINEFTKISYFGEVMLEIIVEKTEDLQTIINDLMESLKIELDLTDFNYRIFKIMQSKLGMHKAKSIKHILNQAISLNKYIYQNKILGSQEDWYVTEKSDGTRAIISYQSDKKLYLIHSQISEINLQIPDNIHEFILDVEIVEDKFYIIDILYWKRLFDTFKFHQRYEKINELLEQLGKQDILIKKTFHKIEKDNLGMLEKIYEKFKNVDSPYIIDGLIFNNDKAYWDMNIYKWKPVELLTIDFLVKKASPKMIGLSIKSKPGFQVYILFCGITLSLFQNLRMRRIDGYFDLFPEQTTQAKYFPIQFIDYLYYHPESEPDIDDQICEFSYIPDSGWKFIKVRLDRLRDYKRGLTYGNEYRTAESIWDIIHNPLTMENLINPDKMYFAKTKENKDMPVTAFNSFVKQMLTNELKQYQARKELTVTDLCSGKGQDLFRYAKNGVRNLYCFEKDIDAINEFNSRKLTLNVGNIAIQVFNIDLNESYKSIIKLVDHKSEYVYCNFAIHYLIYSSESLDNIFNIVDHFLDSCGRFIFTCFDGKKVFELLKDKDRVDFLNLDGEAKYIIEKKYKSKKLENYGQKIGVKLPFNNESYDEFLINLDTIIDYFEKNGYELEKRSSFGSYLDRFKTHNNHIFQQLTESDTNFVSLYSYVSLWKKPNKKKY